MTKSKIVEISELLISNINKLKDTGDIHEVFYLYDVIKEQLEELYAAKVDYLYDVIKEQLEELYADKVDYLGDI